MKVNNTRHRNALKLFFAAVIIFLALSSSFSTTFSSAPQATTYELDSKMGKFIAHAFAGGLFWFKGHDHYLAARDFSGEVQITSGTITPASLHLAVNAGLLEET